MMEVVSLNPGLVSNFDSIISLPFNLSRDIVFDWYNYEFITTEKAVNTCTRNSSIGTNHCDMA